MPRPTTSNDAYIGEVMLFAGNYAPEGWEPCNGKELLVKDNQALFSVIGVCYGGDGITKFALPDLRCLIPMHAFEPRFVGKKTQSAADDAPAVALTSLNELPPHAHEARFRGTETQVSGTVDITAKKTPGQPQLTDGAFLGEGASGNSFGAASIYVPAPAMASEVHLRGGAFTAKTTPQGSVEVGRVGASKPIKLPHLAMTWCICVQGLYPVRPC